MDDSILNEIAVKKSDEKSIITVVGVGGGGGNAVNYMWETGIRNVSFMICNTDDQVLNNSPIKNKVRLGKSGLGAGNLPAEGRRAATEAIDEIGDKLRALDTHMLFITAGMGGGTGTGAAPVIAKYAKEAGILTVAIVTSPLLIEGQLRYEQAMQGIRELRECVDSLLVINNENIQNLYLDDPTAVEAFNKANEILACAAKGISEIITVKNSYINVDFADVSRVMTDSGRAHMSVERASGKDRAKIAVQQSLTSPLLDQNSIKGAKNILLSIATSDQRLLRYNSEMLPILKYVQDNARMEEEDGTLRTANIIWGISIKPELDDDLEIVLVATGFEEEDDDIDFGALFGSQFSIDPNSPIIRIDKGRKRETKEPVIDLISPIANGESVVLSEREPRYANIERLLKTPAYIARKARLKGDKTVSTPPRENEDRDTKEGELF